MHLSTKMYQFLSRPKLNCFNIFSPKGFHAKSYVFFTRVNFPKRSADQTGSVHPKVVEFDSSLKVFLVRAAPKFSFGVDFSPKKSVFPKIFLNSVNFLFLRNRKTLICDWDLGKWKMQLWKRNPFSIIKVTRTKVDFFIN